MKESPTFVFQNGKAYAVVGKRIVASADTIEELDRKLAEFGGEEYGDPHGEMSHGRPETGEFGADEFGDEPLENPECPMCGGPGVPLGQLGTKSHFRCRNCGMDFSPTDVPGPEDQGVAGQGMENAYPHDEHQGLEDPMDPRLGKQIVTPNGLRGTVLGKTKDLWGETVTVRFENGRIKHLPVTPELKFASVEEEEKPAVDHIASLEQSLTGSVDGTRESLTARHDELTQIKRGATDLLRQGAAHSELERLHNIVVQADYETDAVNDALAYLDDAEPFIPTAPFEPQAAEQESVGGNGGSWLDDTINEMVSEAKNTNYDTLMDEGPEAFIAEQDTPLLDDGEAVRAIASKYIRSKTAGANEEVRETYEKVWLDRVDQVRQAAVGERQEVVKKEAAVEEYTDDGNDEGLFL